MLIIVYDENNFAEVVEWKIFKSNFFLKQKRRTFYSKFFSLLCSFIVTSNTLTDKLKLLLTYLGFDSSFSPKRYQANRADTAADLTNRL